MDKEVTPEALSSARIYVRKKWEGFLSGDIKNNNGIFCGFKAKGTVSYNVNEGACHYDLKRKEFTGTNLLVTMLRPYTMNNCANYHTLFPSVKGTWSSLFVEATKDWHEYMLNRSFFSEYLYIDTETPELSDPSLLQAYVFKGSTPVNVLAAACVLTRHPREHMRIVVMWWLLSQAGYDETLALWIAELFGCGSGDQGFGNNYSQGEEDTLIKKEYQNGFFSVRGHTIFRHGWGSSKHVQAFVSKIPVVKEVPLCEGKGYSHLGISNVFMGNVVPHNSSDMDRAFTSGLAHILKDLKNGVTRTAPVIVNPFSETRDEIRYASFSFDDFIQYNEEITHYLMTGFPLMKETIRDLDY